MASDITAINPDIISSLILQGDIGKLNSNQRVEYITKMCERVGVDPLTQPFKILRLQNKEVLYADKGCAQQLCKVYQISTEITRKEKIDDIYIVTTRAKLPDGRYTDEDGAVSVLNLKGDNLANALMKANTKSKRRAVLALCGLGLLDESEIETIKGAQTYEPPKMTTEAPKKVEAPKVSPAVAEAEIVPPKPAKPKEKAIAKPKPEPEPIKEEEAQKKKKSVKERLESAKNALGESLYEGCLMTAAIKEEDITSENIDFIIRGMRIVYEDLQKQKVA